MLVELCQILRISADARHRLRPMLAKSEQIWTDFNQLLDRSRPTFGRFTPNSAACGSNLAEFCRSWLKSGQTWSKGPKSVEIAPNMVSNPGRCMNVSKSLRDSSGPPWLTTFISGPPHAPNSHGASRESGEATTKHRGRVRTKWSNSGQICAMLGQFWSIPRQVSSNLAASDPDLVVSRPVLADVGPELVKTGSNPVEVGPTIRRSLAGLGRSRPSSA